MKWDYGDEPEKFDVTGPGLFISNEGNFQYGNATLSYYNPATCEVQNEVFLRANGMKLGDVAQSLCMHDNRLWIVVNNSHVIFAVDTRTFRETGRIENLPSPRYICFLNDDKAYVSQLWNNRIIIVDPKRYEITGSIEVPGMAAESGSTEQMVLFGKYLYCSCWSYQNRIIRIDTETDRVVDDMVLGIQPKSLVLDRNGKLWCMTDGGYFGSPYGYENPALFRIDAATFTVERKFEFPLTSSPRGLCLTNAGDMLYWLNDDVWRMEVTAEALPSTPFLSSRNTIYYGMAVNPDNGEVYVADAIDYRQQGMVYRYSPDGKLIDEFYVGITPNSFCFKNR
ncbi:MAG: YncE family protein [Muribaculaceae bacterium]|nr:YncE family protein [Muribaculaceae bacterium]